MTTAGVPRNAWNANAMSGEERKEFDLWSDDSVDGRLKMQGTYRQMNPYLHFQIDEAELYNFGAKVGAKSGFVGAVIGAAPWICGVVSGPFSAITAVVTASFFSTVIGSRIGLASAKKLSEYKIEHDLSFLNWKKMHIKDKVYRKFAEFIISDPVLKDYVCPITHELIDEPLCGPTGRRYEASALLAILDENQGEAFVDGVRLMKKQLSYDTSYKEKVWERLEVLIRDPELDAVLKSGIRAYFKVIRNETEARMKCEMDKVLDAMKLNKLSVDELTGVNDALNRRYACLINDPFREDIEEEEAKAHE